MIRAFARLFINLIRLPLLFFWPFMRMASRPRAKWLHIRLRPRLVEIERPLSWLSRFIPELDAARPSSLSLLRRLAHHVREDPRMEGVVVDLPPLEAGWGAVSTLRKLLLDIKASGKKVVVYLSQGGGNRELYIASAADRVLASPTAQLAPLGIAASVRYFKPLLEKLGLDLEVHRRAEYKTAMEFATHEDMSESQREQLSAILDGMDRQLVAALSERPGMDEEAVRGLFGEALLNAELAKERGLVDDLCYEDELPARLTEGEGIDPIVRAPRYYMYKEARPFLRIFPRAYIAIVPVLGAIQGGATGSGARQGMLVSSLRAARQDPRIQGVVLYVDSPGGSALASDLIHREVARLAEKKPVVAYFGDVAASGGYYVAASAHAIVAQPMTITGSIGVISARLVLAGLLEKIGVRTATLKKAPHADMLASPRALEESERAILEREVQAHYESFVKVVASGRDRPFEEVEPLARGRVWTGADALERGLVDQLGGMQEAIEQVQKRLDRPRELEALPMWPRYAELPPAEPPKAKEAAALALASLDPSMAELLRLAGEPRERVLYYAAGLPEIH